MLAVQHLQLVCVVVAVNAIAADYWEWVQAAKVSTADLYFFYTQVVIIL